MSTSLTGGTPRNPKGRIAILGSAFDPVHYGHCAMAALVLACDFADSVWFCPSPTRWDKTPMAGDELRLSWTFEAARTLARAGLNVDMTDAEIRMGDYRGSLVFLERLAEVFPEAQFSMILGLDAFRGILGWRDPVAGRLNGHALLARFPLIVVPRGDTARDEISDFVRVLETDMERRGMTFHSAPSLCPAFHEAQLELPGRPLSAQEIARLSSTEIRADLHNASRKTPRHFIFDEVEQLILAHNPYLGRRRIRE